MRSRPSRGVRPAADRAERQRFAAARRLVRFHYQWLVVNDYLKTVTFPGTVDKVLVGGPSYYKPLAGRQALRAARVLRRGVPLRPQHGARGGYDHNRNFGPPVPPKGPSSRSRSSTTCFGSPATATRSIPPTSRRASRTLPRRADAAVQLDHRVGPDVEQGRRQRGALRPQDRHAPRRRRSSTWSTRARRTRIQDDAVPTNKPLRQFLRSLAQRNLLRGYLLSIPTGQAVAGAMGDARC